MKEYTEKVIFTDKEYKTTSYYGNPSYWVWFRSADDENALNVCGYTGSNCACGYGVSNFRRGDAINITCTIANRLLFFYNRDPKGW